MKLNATDFDGFKKKRKKLLKMRKRRISITFLSLIISIQATLISFKKKIKSHYLELRVNNLVEFSVTILP